MKGIIKFVEPLLRLSSFRLSRIETIIPSKLSLSDRYKLILPKIKYHKIKMVDPNKEINLFKLENSVDYKKMKTAKNGEHIYHSCIIAKAKNENLYVREFIEHYLNIGVEKFYFGDKNEKNYQLSSHKGNLST